MNFSPNTANSQLGNYRIKGQPTCMSYYMYVHTTYMTYIHDNIDITYMCTCWYRVPQYLYHRTLPPTGAHYFKRYKKNINLYYLPPFIDQKPCPAHYFKRYISFFLLNYLSPFIDKKPCPAHYLQKIYIFFFIKLFIPIYRLETLPCPLFTKDIYLFFY